VALSGDWPSFQVMDNTKRPARKTTHLGNPLRALGGTMLDRVRGGNTPPREMILMGITR
jgi:hypothetical protein